MSLNKTYTVFLTGKISPDFDESQAKSCLAKLFKADLSEIEKLIGDNSEVKDNLSKEQATKYWQAINNCGVICKIKSDKALEDKVASLQLSDKQTVAGKPAKLAIFGIGFVLLASVGGYTLLGSSEDNPLHSNTTDTPKKNSADTAPKEYPPSNISKGKEVVESYLSAIQQADKELAQTFSSSEKTFYKVISYKYIRDDTVNYDYIYKYGYGIYNADPSIYIPEWILVKEKVVGKSTYSSCPGLIESVERIQKALQKPELYEGLPATQSVIDAMIALADKSFLGGSVHVSFIGGMNEHLAPQKVDSQSPQYSTPTTENLLIIYKACLSEDNFYRFMADTRDSILRLNNTENIKPSMTSNYKTIRYDYIYDMTIATKGGSKRYVNYVFTVEQHGGEYIIVDLQAME